MYESSEGTARTDLKGITDLTRHRKKMSLIIDLSEDGSRIDPQPLMPSSEIIYDNDELDCEAMEQEEEVENINDSLVSSRLDIQDDCSLSNIPRESIGFVGAVSKQIPLKKNVKSLDVSQSRHNAPSVDSLVFLNKGKKDEMDYAV